MWERKSKETNKQKKERKKEKAKKSRKKERKKENNENKTVKEKIARVKERKKERNQYFRCSKLIEPKSVWPSFTSSKSFLPKATNPIFVLPNATRSKTCVVSRRRHSCKCSWLQHRSKQVLTSVAQLSSLSD